MDIDDFADTILYDTIPLCRYCMRNKFKESA